MSKSIEIKEKIILYTNQLEKDLFIQNKIQNKIEQILTVSIYAEHKNTYTPDGMVPYGCVEIIGKATSSEAQTIKSIISEIRTMIANNNT